MSEEENLIQSVPPANGVQSPTLSSASESTDDQPIQVKVKFDKDESKQEQNDNIMPPLLEYIDANVIGRDTVFEGPYGRKQGIKFL